jgi:apolipoprotein N-acyltransferase
MRIPSIRFGRELGAAASGAMLALAFPLPGWSGLAWVAPGLILFSAAGQSGFMAFRTGYLAGLVYWLISLRWLLQIPFPAGAVAGWLALGAYLALYPALWVGGSWALWEVVRDDTRADRDRGEGVLGSPRAPWRRPIATVAPGIDPSPHPSAASPLDTGSDVSPAARPTWLLPVAHVMAMSWVRRTAWTLGCAAAWVALEMIRSRLFTGFPWNPLGVSQYQITPLIQISAWTGVYGVSFLVAWCSLALITSLARVAVQPSARWAWRAEAGLPLIVLTMVLVAGMRPLLHPAPARARLKVALIQPSIPQTLIWDPKEDDHRFDQLLRLTDLALATSPDLLIWPEAAVPNLLRYDQARFEAIASRAAARRAWMILGADDAEPRLATTDPNDADYYNSSFLISPAGRIASTYRKQRLVIFGEYVPLSRWLPFMKWLTPIQGAFEPGLGPVAYAMPSLNAKTSVLICFEDVFPHGAREHVEDDTDFLVNLTNNGWFGESSAQWQHAANAVFRAVENRTPLVRATNNGLTCWIDPFGRIRDVLADDAHGIYGQGFRSFDVPLGPTGPRPAPTFYRRHGDAFGWACVGASLLPMAGAALGRVRRPKAAGSAR